MNPKSPITSLLLALVATIALSPLGCKPERATPELCRAILDRIVELELRERGFRDPALAARKRSELEQTLAPELRKCEHKPVAADALACIGRAKNAEQISHSCLR